MHTQIAGQSAVASLPAYPQLRVRQDLNEACFERGREILVAGEGALLAVSVGNSFFTEGHIAAVLEAVAPSAGKIKIFVTAPIAHHTLQGMGMTEDEAKHEAHKAGNNRRNRALRALQSPRLQGLRGRVSMLDWKNEVLLVPAYAKQFHAMQKLYQDSTSFRKAVYDTSAAVIRHGLGAEASSEYVTRGVVHGKHFLLKELALILAAPEIMQGSRVAYVYHRRWPVLESLLDGVFDGLRRERVGFVVVE